MGNLGRYVCVALPFLLTLASLIALLVGGLAGVVGNKDGLYMFRVNLTELQVKPTTLASLVGRSPEPVPLPQAAPLISAATSHSVRAQGAAPLIAAATGSQGKANAAGNITAADLGLNKIYDVNLWGYCFTPQSGDRSCLQPKFNWAESEVNSTLTNITKVASAVGKNVTMPKEVTDALQTFATVSRWTEIVFIIAAIALGVALVLGIVSNCSRAVSCLTWVVSGIASAAACAFAALATATAVVVVGTAEGTAKFYGVHADFNGNFLATIWIAVAFALAAGFFWIFTICCCKPEHRSRSKRHSDSEKHMPVGGYAPLHDNQHAGGFQNNSSYYHNQYGAPPHAQPARSDMAYEPYSHARN